MAENWSRAYRQAVQAAGGRFVRRTKHGDLYRLGETHLLLTDESRSCGDWRAERNAWASLRRAQRGQAGRS